MKGFTWKDVSDMSPTPPESELTDLYGTSDVRVRGHLVMKAGTVVDEEWYRGKLERLRRGRRLTKKMLYYNSLS